MKRINQLKRHQLFNIIGDSDAIYKYHCGWLEDGMPWQYQYQNVDTLDIYITTELLEVTTLEPDAEEMIESLKLRIKELESRELELKEKLSKFLTNTVR